MSIKYNHGDNTYSNDAEYIPVILEPKCRFEHWQLYIHPVIFEDNVQLPSNN